VTIHDAIHLSHPPSRAAAIYARAMMTLSARTAAVLFTPSESARRDVATRLGVDAARFRVVPNAVDGRFAPPSAGRVEEFRVARGLPPAWIFCVGSHRPHKNVAAAVDAFVAAALPDTALVLAAADEEGAGRLRPLARPGVRILAGVADDEMPLLYGGARFVVAPSIAEGFGLGPLEACACGAPVAATAIPSHVEVLGDAAEWIGAAGGAADIAAALTRLARDGARRSELSRRGPERARRFRWEAAARATLDGWRAAAGRAPGSGSPLL